MGLLSINSNTWFVTAKDGKSFLVHVAGSVNTYGRLLQNLESGGYDINDANTAAYFDENSLITLLKQSMTDDLDPKKSNYTVMQVFDEGAKTFPNYAQLSNNLKSLLSQETLDSAMAALGGEKVEQVQEDLPLGAEDVPIMPPK
jgi:hypothetical protein